MTRFWRAVPHTHIIDTWTQRLARTQLHCRRCHRWYQIG